MLYYEISHLKRHKKLVKELYEFQSTNYTFLQYFHSSFKKYLSSFFSIVLFTIFFLDFHRVIHDTFYTYLAVLLRRIAAILFTDIFKGTLHHHFIDTFHVVSSWMFYRKSSSNFFTSLLHNLFHAVFTVPFRTFVLRLTRNNNYRKRVSAFE